MPIQKEQIYDLTESELTYNPELVPPFLREKYEGKRYETPPEFSLCTSGQYMIFQGVVEYFQTRGSGATLTEIARDSNFVLFKEEFSDSREAGRIGFVVGWINGTIITALKKHQTLPDFETLIHQGLAKYGESQT